MTVQVLVGPTEQAADPEFTFSPEFPDVFMRCEESRKVDDCEWEELQKLCLGEVNERVLLEHPRGGIW